jgi:hypothetical protein
MKKHNKIRLFAQNFNADGKNWKAGNEETYRWRDAGVCRVIEKVFIK